MTRLMHRRTLKAFAGGLACLAGWMQTAAFAQPALSASQAFPAQVQTFQADAATDPHKPPSGEGSNPQTRPEVQSSEASQSGANNADEQPEDGDVVILKTGARLTHVQVVRRTPLICVVQLVEGVRVELPGSQIEEVIYDDIEMEGDTLCGGREDQSKSPKEIEAQRITYALNRALSRPFPEPITYPPKDFVAILRDIASQLEIEIEIDQQVRSLPAEKRRWRVDAPAGTTLLQLLREDFSEQFPSLVVLYPFDKIRITTREAARKAGFDGQSGESTSQKGSNN